MSAWAVVGILAGFTVLFILVFALVDWIYAWHTKREFLRRLVQIAREHQLEHSKYLYPED